MDLQRHLKRIGRKGGRAYWAKLTPEQRSERARQIVAARWAKRKKKAA